jgi:hypothetical protein
LRGANISARAAPESTEKTNGVLNNGAHFAVDQRTTIANALPNGQDQVWLRLAATNPSPLNQGWVMSMHPKTGASLCTVAPAGSGSSSSGSFSSNSSFSDPAPGPGGVRMVNSQGFNYPAARVTATAAENYGVISTETSTQAGANERVPSDLGPSDLGLDAAAESAGAATVSAVAAGPPKACKVLVTGEASADIESIQRTLAQVEKEAREHYAANHIAIEVVVKQLTEKQMRDLDTHLPNRDLSSYHAVIMACNASRAWLSITGAGGKLDRVRAETHSSTPQRTLVLIVLPLVLIMLPPFPCFRLALLSLTPSSSFPVSPPSPSLQVLEKLRVFGVPEISLYIVATGDTEAIESDTDEALKTSMGHTGAAVGGLGAGPVAGAELVSEGLKRRLGPMQLAHVQDFFTAARFLSWNRQSSPSQRRLLRRHMQYLAHHKPKRAMDSNSFRCADCQHDFTLAEVKEMLAAGKDAGLDGPALALCSNCSRGYCGECGQQMPLLEWCACGAGAIKVETLVSSSELASEQKVRACREQALRLMRYALRHSSHSHTRVLYVP